MTDVAPINRARSEVQETGQIVVKDLMVGKKRWIFRFWLDDEDDGSESALALLCLNGGWLYCMVEVSLRSFKSRSNR